MVESVQKMIITAKTTIGVPIATCLPRLYQPCTNSVPSSNTIKNSQKTVKTAKMTIGVPIVTCLPRLYQPCTNSVPIVKYNQKQSKDSQNSKNDYWCTNRHMTTHGPPNTQSPRPPNTQSPYRSSIDTVALNCLVFEKIAFLHFGIKIQDFRHREFQGFCMGKICQNPKIGQLRHPVAPQPYVVQKICRISETHWPLDYNVE